MGLVAFWWIHKVFCIFLICHFRSWQYWLECLHLINQDLMKNVSRCLTKQQPCSSRLCWLLGNSWLHPWGEWHVISKSISSKRLLSLKTLLGNSLPKRTVHRIIFLGSVQLNVVDEFFWRSNQKSFILMLWKSWHSHRWDFLCGPLSCSIRWWFNYH